MCTQCMEETSSKLFINGRQRLGFEGLVQHASNYLFILWFIGMQQIAIPRELHFMFKMACIHRFPGLSSSHDTNYFMASPMDQPKEMRDISLLHLMHRVTKILMWDKCRTEFESSRRSILQWIQDSLCYTYATWIFNDSMIFKTWFIARSRSPLDMRWRFWILNTVYNGKYVKDYESTFGKYMHTSSLWMKIHICNADVHSCTTTADVHSCTTTADISVPRFSCFPSGRVIINNNLNVFQDFNMCSDRIVPRSWCLK